MAARELRIAAQQGDCGKLRTLLHGGGAPVVDERTEVIDAARNKVRLTALMCAVGSNQHAAVELLLEHSANPNLAASDGATPLGEAASGGYLPILRTLLDRKDIAIDAVHPKDQSTAFHSACFYSQTNCAVELARRGCDMTLQTKDGETGKQIAERMKHTAVLAGLRALVVEQLRAKQQPTAQAEGLLAAEAAARELRIAAQEGDCGKLRELLDGGGASAMNERTEITRADTGEKTQVTALLQAVIANQHAAVELLLDRKANPNIPTSCGFTPLMQAATGPLPILQTLLDRETIAIDAAHTRHSSTAFHYACDRDHADCAVELIRHGCNTQLLDADGQTGWDIAKWKGHKLLIRRCLLVQKLTLRNAQQQGNSTMESPAPAAEADASTVPQVNEDPERQAKAAKKAVANRKKKERKRAKKAAAQQQLLLSHAEAAAEAELTAETTMVEQQLLLSQVEAEESEPAPILEQPGAESEPAVEAAQQAELTEAEPTEAEPKLDERTQQLQALTELGVQQWSTEQVLEWVALAGLPPESVSVISSAFESLDLDGEELLAVILKTLQKKLMKHGAQDAEALAELVIEQRDALMPEGSTAPPASDRPECPICMEPFCDDASGLRVPRLLTNCGHTVCHGCITDMLTLVAAGKKKKKNDAKACKCPTCSKVTEVEGGDAATLFRNFTVA